jgi:hypothetical protein
MGPLGGLGGIGWLLPAGAALIAGQNSPPIPGDMLHYRAPTSLTLIEYSAETAALSTSDRFRIARARTAMLVRDWDNWSLSINASRARSEHEAAGRIDRRDGFATYQLGATTRTDLPGGLTFGAGGTLTYMTRRLGPLDFDARPRHSFIADAGFSIARGQDGRLSLSYVDVAPASSRTPLGRMAELIGGSPRAAKGLRIAFSHRAQMDRPGSLAWGVDASAMRLSEQDSALLGAPPRAVDRRIALNLARRF